jgi:hypothetical protein
MVQVLDRPDVREHEGDTLLREAPPREVLPEVRPEMPPVRHEFPHPELEVERPKVKRLPIRWMRWLVVGVVLAFAAGALLVVFNDNGTTATPAVTRDYRTPDGWERHFAAVGMGTLDYRTADAMERVLAQVQPVMNDHRTADGWERYVGHVTELQSELMAKW